MTHWSPSLLAHHLLDRMRVCLIFSTLPPLKKLDLITGKYHNNYLLQKLISHIFSFSVYQFILKNESTNPYTYYSNEEQNNISPSQESPQLEQIPDDLDPGQEPEQPVIQAEAANNIPAEQSEPPVIQAQAANNIPAQQGTRM